MVTKSGSEPLKKPTIRIYQPPSLRKSGTDSDDVSFRKTRETESEPPMKPPSDDLSMAVERLNLDDGTFEQFGVSFLSEKSKEIVKVPLGAPSNYLHGPNLDYDKLRHIIELYGFPSDLETPALESELRPFNESGFIIKWVDDTHCLVVFSSSHTAELALANIRSVVLKARPVQEASLSSKWKIAKSPGDWTLPYKKRPPSDSSVASRIISSHLGLPRPSLSSTVLQARKEAKERRERKKRNQQAMWGDD